jgi:membrane protease YdiL (CAAX protease family)
MTGPRFVERFQIPVFFALTLFAWVIWVPQALRRYDLIGWAPSQQSPLNFLTVWSPGLAAMLVTALVLGRSHVSGLFRTLGTWRVAAWWYLFAILFEPLKWGAAYLIDRATGHTYALGQAPLIRYAGAAAAFMVPVALVSTLPNALGEELGWRAFALPRLQARRGPLIASVILGLFWGFWHIPMWLTWQSSDAVWLSILLMLLSMVPAAILFTWLFNATGGSLLLVCLFHASTAMKGYLLPRLPSQTEVILLWVVAAVVVLRGGFLRRRQGVG